MFVTYFTKTIIVASNSQKFEVHFPFRRFHKCLMPSSRWRESPIPGPALFLTTRKTNVRFMFVLVVCENKISLINKGHHSLEGWCFCCFCRQLKPATKSKYWTLMVAGFFIREGWSKTEPAPRVKVLHIQTVNPFGFVGQEAQLKLV